MTDHTGIATYRVIRTDHGDWHVQMAYIRSRDAIAEWSSIRRFRTEQGAEDYARSLLTGDKHPLPAHRFGTVYKAVNGKRRLYAPTDWGE